METIATSQIREHYQFEHILYNPCILVVNYKETNDDGKLFDSSIEFDGFDEMCEYIDSIREIDCDRYEEANAVEREYRRIMAIADSY